MAIQKYPGDILITYVKVANEGIAQTATVGVELIGFGEAMSSPKAMPANTTNEVSVSITIPLDAAPGMYSANIRVYDAAGDMVASYVSVNQVEILEEVVLPDKTIVSIRYA